MLCSNHFPFGLVRQSQANLSHTCCGLCLRSQLKCDQETLIVLQAQENLLTAGEPRVVGRRILNSQRPLVM